MNKPTITAILLSISVASTLVSTTAYAGMERGNHKSHQGHKQFSLMDSNSDGALSKEELLTFHEQRFTSIDTDADGLVTKKEIKAHRQKQRFMRMDSNNDGVISEDEMSLSYSAHNKRSRNSKSYDAE
ncbi:MAG: EF-hand domain-containing protein [Oleispira sp.]|nr:EF-hand domain-containing protein [Oleispira sp.]MBL4882631.1 EF-hand domain-containing protein [Oleispira sp.]